MPEITLTKEQQKSLSYFTSEEHQPARWAKRKVAREYHEGVHSTQLTERQRQYLQLRTGQEFNDNYCPVVVDALAERLTVTGFTVTAATDAAVDLVQAKLSEWMKQSNFDELQNDVHTGTIRDGDGYILVEWDNERLMPAFSYEMAANGECGVDMFYDARRLPRFGSKLWEDDGIERLNLYYPDRIEKYIKAEGGWRPHTDEGGAWPEPWAAGIVPVVHFKNKANGYRFGQSELVDVIPLQNALNKAVIDLVASADTTAFRLYWMTGGDPSGVSVVPGSWIYSENEAAKIGHIPGEDLSKLIDYKDAFATEVARVSRTPVSLFQMSGQVAAEGTLKQQESGLVSRAVNRQVTFGNAWERAMQTAIRLWNVYGPDPKLPEDAAIEAQWKDPETRNGLDYLSELEKKRGLGVPYEVIWSEAGYTNDEISAMRDSEEYKLLRIRQLFEAANAGGIDPGTLARQVGWTDEEIAVLYAGQVQQ